MRARTQSHDTRRPPNSGLAQERKQKTYSIPDHHILRWPIYVQQSYFFFFFQAEDGIRDYKVTGVQTCALPISFFPDLLPPNPSAYLKSIRVRDLLAMSTGHHNEDISKFDYQSADAVKQFLAIQIGRASCRERV